MAIAEWVEPRVALDTPINIHLTGCPHSCAQHYIGDIGLLASRVAGRRDERGHGRGLPHLRRRRLRPGRGIARELYRDVQAEGCPALIEAMLRAYLRIVPRAARRGDLPEFAPAGHEVEACSHDRCAGGGAA